MEKQRRILLLTELNTTVPASECEDLREAVDMVDLSTVGQVASQVWRMITTPDGHPQHPVLFPNEG